MHDYEKVDSNVWSDWIKALLDTVGEVKMAPTHASRFYYLGCAIAQDAVRCIHPDLPLRDAFQTMGSMLSVDAYFHRDLWLEQSIYDGFRLLYHHLRLPTTSLDKVAQQHAQMYPNMYTEILDPTGLSSASRVEFKQRVQKFLDARSTDGSRHAQAFVPSDAYPNRGVFIKTTSGADQDLNTDLPNPKEWCALHVQTTDKYQSYLTPEWGSVRGVLSTDVVESITNEVASTFYPSEEVHAQEIEDVLNMSENLSSRERMIAEFWAGGPSTCTPPGFWLLFAIYGSRCHRLSIPKQVELYYDMSTSLFQAGICAWKLKRQFLQERPIQAIRKLRPIRDVRMFDGTTGLNTTWLPYQESNFVTPPFPDFVSGHSTFSSIGSKVLTNAFGTNIIPTNYNFSASDVQVLSPILKKMDPTCNLCQMCIYPRTSGIDDQPPTSVTLAWTTWDQMADEAGKSRLYGGIHYESSNQGGLALGRLVYHHLQASSLV